LFIHVGREQIRNRLSAGPQEKRRDQKRLDKQSLVTPECPRKVNWINNVTRNAAGVL